MILLQADTLTTDLAQQAVATSKALLQGDTTAMQSILQQCVNFCVEVGKSILLAAVIYFVGRLVIRGLNTLLARMLERRNVDASIQSFTKSFVNILLTILLLISVISALGVNTTSFAALLASVGLAGGMALSGNLQNLAGGFVILLFKPFHVGDFIEAQGTSGTVSEIQIFHTIVTTVDNKIVYLPNGVLSSGSVVNYSNALRRVDLTYGVCYDESPERVRQAVMEVIEANPKILSDEGHKPFIALSQLADSSVNFTVRVWTRGTDYWDVYLYMQENVYNTFNKKGISFPFPQLTVHQA